MTDTRDCRWIRYNDDRCQCPLCQRKGPPGGLTDPRTLLVEQQYKKLIEYLAAQAPLGPRVQHDPTMQVLVNAIAHVMVDDRIALITEVKGLLSQAFRGGSSGTPERGVVDDPNGQPPVR